MATSGLAELEVTIAVQTSIADASALGFFGPVLGRCLTATITMR